MDINIPTKDPLISVILPIFNAAPYLSQSLASLASQTETNFKVLAIYDDSIDCSLDILQTWAKKDPRVQIIYGGGKGLVNALNLGLQHACGRFIARMDADDISLPDRFQKQIQYLESHSLDVCGCQLAIMNKNGTVYRHVSMPITSDWVTVILACTTPFAHGSVMIRRSFLESTGIQYAPGTIEDYELWCNLHNACANMGNVSEELYFYREHQSLSKVRASQNQIATYKQRRSFVSQSELSLKISIQRILDDEKKISTKDGSFLLLASYLIFKKNKTTLVFKVLKRVSFISIVIAMIKLIKGF